MKIQELEMRPLRRLAERPDGGDESRCDYRLTIVFASVCCSGIAHARNKEPQLCFYMGVGLFASLAHPAPHTPMA